MEQYALRMQEKDEEVEKPEQYSETTKNILLSKTIDLINQALDADEKNDFQNAFLLYTRALDILMNIMKNETNENRKTIYRKKITEILERAETIKKSLNENQKTKQTILDENIPKTIDMEENDQNQQMECEIFFTVDGVKCFSVMGHDKQLIASGALQVLKTTDSRSGLHLLKLEDFEFPLTKQIPCLRTSRGNYVVPMSGGIFYGFVFPQQIPDQYLTLFETKMEEICLLKKPEIKISEEKSIVLPPKTSEAVITDASTKGDVTVKTLESLASGIQTGTVYAVAGLAIGTKYAAQGIVSGGQYLKSWLTPNEKPAEVSPALKSTLSVASTVSPYGVKISKALVKGLVVMAEEVGSAVASGLAESKWLQGPSVFNGPKSEAAKKVGWTTLSAIANVWESLETAGQILVETTSNTTVDIVQHKYGEDAAMATADGLSVAMDAVHTAYILDQMGVKKLAKRAAISTGKQTVITYLEKQDEQKMIE